MCVRGRSKDGRPAPPAQAKGYVARSAFKLQEIQQKHKLIPPGGQVLDLGCHPGAWLQVGAVLSLLTGPVGCGPPRPQSGGLYPTQAWGEVIADPGLCQRWAAVWGSCRLSASDASCPYPGVSARHPDASTTRAWAQRSNRLCRGRYE